MFFHSINIRKDFVKGRESIFVDFLYLVFCDDSKGALRSPPAPLRCPFGSK